MIACWLTWPQQIGKVDICQHFPKDLCVFIPLGIRHLEQCLPVLAGQDFS